MGLGSNSSTTSSGRVAVVASAVFAFAGLVTSTAWLVWTVARPLPQPRPGPAEATAGTAPDTLSQRFSQLPDVAMISAGPGAPTSQSNAAFKLFAIRTSLQGNASAIIAVNDSAQRSYFVGDELTPGVRLSRVEPEWIEIDADGQTLTLAMPSAPGRPGEPSSAHLSNLSAPGMQGLPLAPANRANGGYRITSQVDLSLLAGSGLKPGDIILQVDGADVSPALLAQHAARLQAGSSLEIVYERDGQTATTRIGSGNQ